MIKIILKNSDTHIWDKTKYTDYIYDGKCFIVINNEEWVGIYNMDSIVYITTK